MRPPKRWRSRRSSGSPDPYLGNDENEPQDQEQQQRHWTDPKEPVWALVHAEMRRKHVTLALLWQEYRREHPEGYGYSWFCQHYRAWQGHIDVVMRQSHKAGEKLFVDWAGDTVAIIDAESGEVSDASLFVAVLGASNYTYAEAFADQRTESFLSAHVPRAHGAAPQPDLLHARRAECGDRRAASGPERALLPEAPRQPQERLSRT